jgi:hypothetical protein
MPPMALAAISSHDRASCLLSNGQLVFGGTHGLTIFDPVRPYAKHDIRMVVETLKVHNKIISPA